MVKFVCSVMGQGCDSSPSIAIDQLTWNASYRVSIIVACSCLYRPRSTVPHRNTLGTGPRRTVGPAVVRHSCVILWHSEILLCSNHSRWPCGARLRRPFPRQHHCPGNWNVCMYVRVPYAWLSVPDWFIVVFCVSSHDCLWDGCSRRAAQVGVPDGSSGTLSDINYGQYLFHSLLWPIIPHQVLDQYKSQVHPDEFDDLYDILHDEICTIYSTMRMSRFMRNVSI